MHSVILTMNGYIIDDNAIVLVTAGVVFNIHNTKFLSFCIVYYKNRAKLYGNL